MRKKKANITLQGVKEDINEQDVSVAMDSIIAGNIFSTSGGDLKSKHSAKITERNITALSVK